MNGTHKNGDFGFNGYNADFNVLPFGEIPKGMNGFLDDAADWVKKNITGGQTAAQAIEQAQTEERRKMLLLGALLLSGILILMMMRKKK